MAMIVSAADALSGKFTINTNGDQIVFSKGNLQATTSDLGTNWTWGFATNQWSYIGNAAANNAITANKTVSANGTVDLFGWSTAATYFGINKSKDSEHYSGNFEDWGKAIGDGWRTLSGAEWTYLFHERAKADELLGFGSVCGVYGTIILPDDWTLPAGATFNNAKDKNVVWQDGGFYYNENNDSYSHNTYASLEEWSKMADAGAVFLPAAGRRLEANVYDGGSYGFYWSSTLETSTAAYYMAFGPDNLNPKSPDGRSNAYAVRLVKAAPNEHTDPNQAAITITMSKITSSSAMMSVVPESQNQTYYFTVTKSADVVGLSDEELIEKVLIAEMDSIIDYYNGKYDVTYSDQLSKGNDSYEFAKLTANTEYLALAAYIGTDGKPIDGKLAKQTFKTTESSSSGGGSSDLTFSIQKTSTGITVTPSNDSEYWDYYFMELSEFISSWRGDADQIAKAAYDFYGASYAGKDALTFLFDEMLQAAMVPGNWVFVAWGCDDTGVTTDAQMIVFILTSSGGGEDVHTRLYNVQSDNVQSTKVIKNGQLIIERDGKMYNAQGAEVK